MSPTSPNISLGTIGSTAGIPNLNVAEIPANIRNGNAKAMQAYSEGLAFESVLVNELTQQLAGTMFAGSGQNSGAAAGSGAADVSTPAGGSTDGLMGGASAYGALIPQALSSSIMAGGGLGLAEQFAQQLDPALASPGGAGGSTRKP